MFGAMRQSHEERLVTLFNTSSTYAFISRNGVGLTVARPVTLITGHTATGIKCAPDASFVVTTGGTNCSIYNFPSKTATSFGTAIRSITVASTSTKAIAISPDLLKIAVGGGNTTVTIISRTSTSQSWTAATTTTITAGGTVMALDFGPAADYPLAIGLAVTPFIEAWYLSGGTTWTKTTAFAALATGLGGGTSNNSVQTVAFNPSGDILAVGMGGNPWLRTYTKSGNTYTILNTTAIGTGRIDALLWTGTNNLIVSNVGALTAIYVQQNAGSQASVITTSGSTSSALRGFYMDPNTRMVFGGTNGVTLYKSRIGPTGVWSAWVAVTGSLSGSPVTGPLTGYTEGQGY